MSAYIYFVPGVRVCANDKQLPPETGLQHVLDGAFWSPVKVKEGPDGNSGMLLFVEPDPQAGGQQAKLLYDPQKQTWRPVKNENGITHWLGHEIDNPPTYRDLVRPMLTDGYPLRLNDQPFVIPLCTMPEYALSSLPQRFVWRDGGLSMEIKDRYHDLCVRCQRQWNWIKKKEGYEDVDTVDLVLKPYEQAYLCIDILSVNYRVSGPEVCELDLLDSTRINYIIKYALGLHFVEAQLRAEALLEKKVEAGEPAVSTPTAT